MYIYVQIHQDIHTKYQFYLNEIAPVCLCCCVY